MAQGERPPAWESLPESVRKDLVANGEQYLGYKWPNLPATLFLEYARNGNRSRYEHEHFDRRNALTNLIIAECVEGKGRFLDDIANGVWAICEESFWGVPAHIGRQKAGSGLPDPAEPIVDLFAAETGESLAWTYYLLGEQLDRVSPMIRKRIRHEIDRRILTPCLERDDFGWMGFAGGRVNNWNPWCNANWLTCALLVEPDAARRIGAVAKIVRSLDYFFDAYADDGGCDEGPGYWSRAGASLFDCLELLHSATAAQIDVYDQPLVQEIGRYIYRVHIADDYFVNFADASAKAHPSARTGVSLWQADRRRAARCVWGYFVAMSRSEGSGFVGTGRIHGRSVSAGDLPRCRASRRPGQAAAAAGCLARRHPGDDGPLRGRDVERLLRRSQGRPQRREPQPQRRRQLHRLRGRPAHPDRHRRRDLQPQDLQLAALRDLDDAVGVPQPADHRRRDAEPRPAVRGTGRPVRGERRPRPACSLISPVRTRSRRISNHGFARSASIGAKTSRSRRTTRLKSRPRKSR